MAWNASRWSSLAVRRSLFVVRRLTPQAPPDSYFTTESQGTERSGRWPGLKPTILNRRGRGAEAPLFHLTTETTSASLFAVRRSRFAG